MRGKLSRSLALAAAIGVAGSVRAAAPHPRECLLAVGPAQLSFSAFQEASNDNFCRELPLVGKTILVFDTEEAELRDMTIDIRILRDAGQADWRERLEANTVLAPPPQKYLANGGTTSLVHDFAQEGNYIAVIRARSDDGVRDYIGQYAFVVGDTHQRYVGGAVVVSLLAAAYLGTLRVRPSPPGPRAKGLAPGVLGGKRPAFAKKRTPTRGSELHDE
ncbi:MAG TPA: hypothetical protein VEH76_03780 [Methylocystis sp.]|nr:hypothetical protein [Methylocystis sp.]